MNTHEKLLITAANQIGIEWIDKRTEWKMPAIQFTLKDKDIVVFNGYCFPGVSLNGHKLTVNKEATKMVFHSLNIPTPRSLAFTRIGPDERAFCEEVDRLVLKPIDSLCGQGVHVGIADIEAIQQEISKYPNHGGYILEEYHAGYDLRVQSIDNELVAACKRIPAQVVGDGSSSIQELVDKKNEKKREQNPDNCIVIDAETNALLSDVGLSPESVPESNQTVQLKKVANISQGGDVVDVTDEIHPTLFDWVRDICTFLDVPIMGIDMITTDHTADPYQNTVLLELNSAGMWAHHTFSERRTHDIPMMILKSLFNID